MKTIAVEFLTDGLPAGRDISGARPDGLALPSRTANGRFLSRWRNAGAASGLASGLRSLCAADDAVARPAAGFGFDVVLSPASYPTRFFLCPRRNALVNTRGLRLAWLLSVNRAVR